MIEFKESKFYKLLQDFFINNNKETFLQMLAEFYNRTEGIINKNNIQDNLIKELHELYIEYNEKGIDENIVIEKVNYFVENNVKIKDILAKLVINTNKIEDNTEKLNVNTNNIEIINSQMENNTSEINYTNNFLNNTLPLDNSGTKFFAHRGMSEICPENTIPAYEMAGKNKFYGVETDVAVTSDGQFILMHDNTIDRTTTGAGSVETLTYDYIKSQTIDGGNNYKLYPGTKVPSLAEFLICCKKNNLIPLLELKQNFNLNYIESFINEVKKYGMIDKCYIMSFNSAVLQKVREFNTRVKMIILHSEYREDFLNWAVTLKNCGYGIGSTDVTQDQINNCRSKGVFVAIWTVNDYHKAKRLIDLGVDFIISDKIKEVK